MHLTFAFQRSCGLLRSVVAIAMLGIVVVELQGTGVAQGGTKNGVSLASSVPQSAPARSLTLASIDAASRGQDQTVVQLRRFFDDPANVVSVREELKVVADGSATPPFSLTFLGVEGQLPGSLVWQKWSQNYARYGNLLASHSGFRIRDLAKASANYTLHDFGPVVRANRSAHRVVVFPNSLDKAIWLVDIDEATYLPLYTAEYDASLRLLSEVEAIAFTPSAQLASPSPPSIAATSPLTFAAGKVALGSPSGLVEPKASACGEYSLEAVQLAGNPLNNRRSMVLSYTDGVDEFFVIESPGLPEPFAGLPSQQASGTGKPSTIARFRDPSMSVLVFWDNGVGFQVTGRGSLQRLDDIAKQIYTQAILDG